MDGIKTVYDLDRLAQAVEQGRIKNVRFLSQAKRRGMDRFEMIIVVLLALAAWAIVWLGLHGIATFIPPS